MFALAQLQLPLHFVLIRELEPLYLKLHHNFLVSLKVQFSFTVGNVEYWSKRLIGVCHAIVRCKQLSSNPIKLRIIK